MELGAGGDRRPNGSGTGRGAGNHLGIRQPPSQAWRGLDGQVQGIGLPGWLRSGCPGRWRAP